MKEECIICKAPLEYLTENEYMECAVCGKKEQSKARCIQGHYVCDECHTNGMDCVLEICLNEKSKNPVYILEKMMSMPFCHMHGPEHHVMVGAALAAAYKNAGGKIQIDKAVCEIYSRGKNVPGGTCGFWGACGAALSSGIFMSVITNATPLSVEEWGMSNSLTSKVLGKIGEIGGPRCCKRNSYTAITQTVAFAAEKLGVQMELDDIVCTRMAQNNQCIGKRCPFNPQNKK
ncbi:MAG: SAM-dependent methyltransferase [Oscillospiraceae bacterium]|nr:SAM-dependent methyltransferase [Oscillospiraceae bacterium]